MTDTRYITVTECATLIRKALKEQFPTIKFSVRSSSYSMGASVTVAWTDGPTSEAVQRVCRAYEGASFDGMQDLKSYHQGELNGEAVSFGNDWTSCNRTESPEFVTAVAQAYCTRYNKPMPTIHVSSSGKSAWVDRSDYSDYHDYREEIWRKIQETDASHLDKLFEKEDRELAEYDAAVAARKAVEDTQPQEETPEERATYLETVLLPNLRAQLAGFEQMGASYAVEIISKAIAKHEQELDALKQEPVQTLVTVLDTQDGQTTVRVLLAGATSPIRMKVDGELAFYLKRYNARLVDTQTFEMAVNGRVA